MAIEQHRRAAADLQAIEAALNRPVIGAVDLVDPAA